MDNEFVIVEGYENEKGVLISQNNNFVVVAFGQIIIKVPPERIKGREKVIDNKRADFELKRKSFPPDSIDLHGIRYEEADYMINHQIDECILSGKKEFAIIHGHGAGVMKDLVWKKYAKDKRVLNIRYALQCDGGTGKSYITLNI